MPQTSIKVQDCEARRGEPCLFRALEAISGREGQWSGREEGQWGDREREEGKVRVG